LLFSNSCKPNVIVPTDLLVFLFYILRHHPFESPLKLVNVSLFLSVRTAEMSCSLHLDECLPRRIVASLRPAPPRSVKNAKGEVMVLMCFSIHDPLSRCCPSSRA
jgi:hypothetical protein